MAKASDYGWNNQADYMTWVESYNYYFPEDEPMTTRSYERMATVKDRKPRKMKEWRARENGFASAEEQQKFSKQYNKGRKNKVYGAENLARRKSRFGRLIPEDISGIPAGEGGVGLSANQEIEYHNWYYGRPARRDTSSGRMLPGEPAWEWKEYQSPKYNKKEVYSIENLDGYGLTEEQKMYIHANTFSLATSRSGVIAPIDYDMAKAWAKFWWVEVLGIMSEDDWDASGYGETG